MSIFLALLSSVRHRQLQHYYVFRTNCSCICFFQYFYVTFFRTPVVCFAKFCLFSFSRLFAIFLLFFIFRFFYRLIFYYGLERQRHCSKLEVKTCKLQHDPKVLAELSWRACVKLIGGDTECPLQVCQLSRCSEYSLSFLRRDVALFVSTRARDSF